ncbi:MAG: DUF4159 domain-containing protein [Hyphomicrobiaceae bacterium]|nr:DUF4159 domain-containing protein [Hyphomicrobiaceae bacterium]
MSIGALAFLNPWLLAGLVSLPLIYLLLRTVPPRPRQVQFPPTRILVGLDNREKTPAKTPWWLLLIRLLAAALVILALAEPVLNPTRGSLISGRGPVAIVVDNGWAAATHWSERRAMAERMIAAAEAQGRPVAIAATASAAKSNNIRLEAPSAARSSLAALAPQPFAPDRTQTVAALEAVLAGSRQEGVSVVWLTDGIDHGAAEAFSKRLSDIAAGGSFSVVEDGATATPIGVTSTIGAGGKLEARVLRAGGSARIGDVNAFSARGERLGEAAFSFGAGDDVAKVAFDLPLELRNQVTRIEIAGERSAGAVSLIDARSQWHRVGILSGEAQEQAQPLLAPDYYIEKALAPYAEIVKSKDANLAAAIETILKQNATVLILADIGTLSGDLAQRVADWVEKGGVLVRFAGPRLEKGGDNLLPVPLRVGGRTLGGALSWSTPQPLAAFEEQSLFAGLTVPEDVKINRQVLADPARIDSDVAVWARLGDGTPLVTARRSGEGQFILFHVTANSDWSSLPISGLFVEMLRRVATLGKLGAATTGTAGSGDTTAAASGDVAEGRADVLAPLMTLDGFGTLRSPPPTAQALTASKISDLRPSLDHPPGFYGAEASPRALNVLDESAALKPLPPLPAGVERVGLEKETSQPLKAELLLAALALLFADMLAVVLMSLGGLAAFTRRSPTAARGNAAAAIFAVALAASAAAASGPTDALAQTPRGAGDAPAFDDIADVAKAATSKVTLGYVLTGHAETDEASRLGLAGLGRVLQTRTAVTPGLPLPVNISDDEIAFYPVLYWPVLDTADPLAGKTLAKIDAYMKQGGMIIFDTRDYGRGAPTGFGLGGSRETPLQRILGQLDLPRLEPVPEGHVLTKAFYLLRNFPGRWDGGQLWVEADAVTQGGGESRQARKADGVTSIVITANDFAAAWALDERGRPVYPVVPGGEAQREMAFRTGINIVMHALTGNYKADQVHVPALLERLGQ